jgi:endonuclease/exonuclease/phosphatase family metal-dependent hydrolase
VRVRILTLNVLNLEGDPRRQQVINDELRRLEPDLVSLQEVVKTEEHDQLDALLEGTGLTGTHQSDVLPYPMPRQERFGGTAVATRWPHVVVETIDHRSEPDGIQPWCTLATVVEIPDEGEVLFIATTLNASVAGTAAREREAVVLTELDDRHRRNLPTIIAGDLNSQPESSTIRYLTGRQGLEGRSTFFHDAWDVAGEGPGYTWNPDNPLVSSLQEIIVRQPGGVRWRIDYVLVGFVQHGEHSGSCARIEQASLGFDQPVDGIWPSDHFGVVVDVELARDPEGAAALERLLAGAAS